MRDDNLEINQTFFIPAAPEQVWDLLLHQEGLKRWLKADTFVIDIVTGGMIDLSLSRSGKLYRVSGTTGLLRPPNHVVFSWIERNEHGCKWFIPTFVWLHLVPLDNGTQFTVIHRGFKNLPPDDAEEVYRQYQEYWRGGDISERLQSLVNPRESHRND